MKIKENSVLSVIVDDKFIVEYDRSIPFALNIYHNNEEAKIHLKTAPIDFEIHDVERLMTLAKQVYDVLGVN